MYIVEIFIDNEWLRSSFHKNRDHAEICFEVFVRAGKQCRLIHEGKILMESGQ